MKEERLATLVEDPEVHRRLLGKYEGGYSLGVTLNPENRAESALQLRIERDDVSAIPREIVLDGERVPVLVQTGFRVPVPGFR